MDPTGVIELVLLLLVIATALALVARRIGVAYPIVLVLGGLALGLVLTSIPNPPSVELPPELVFVLFLPPILFGAGFFTPIREFKANLRPIGLLAVGLVLFTTVVVGVVVHALLPELSWAAAFAFGAIVAPPDAVAATAIFRRRGVPPRIVTILEGESLVNDATALIAYRFATAAAVTGTFSLAAAGLQFILVAAGGIAIGVVVGRLLAEAWRRVSDPTLEIVISLLVPFAAYLPAEALGASGVLAAVTAGILAGRHAARVLSPNARLMGTGVWSVLIFLINGFAFLLIGVQLPAILDGLTAFAPAELIGLGLAISATVIVARIVWVFPASYLPRWASAKLRARDPYPPVGAVFVVSWAGMRGVVSLAAALALSTNIPDRPLLIYLTLCVILATLVGQGLTLPWIVRRLGVVSGSSLEVEEKIARQAAADAARERLETLATEYPDHLPLVDSLRAALAHEAEHATELANGDDLDAATRERLEHQEIRLALVAAQRDAVIRLRDDGVIGDNALRRIERELDLEAVRAGA
ncbi:MAG: Na+/H+ antiporter [Chloroflexota bacterium]|nr:Na+/H+ antiporter [Chloroflexota bacterium]